MMVFRMSPMTLALPLLFLALAGPKAGEGRRLDEVVATVKTPGGAKVVITLTQLTEEARIVLVSRGALGAAERDLDGPALKAALAWLLDQTVLLEEASRLQVFEVERSDALAELKRFRERFPAGDSYGHFLARTGLDEEQLLSVLKRTVRVQRYLDSRVRLLARVRDSEAEAYYKERQADFPGRSFEQVKEAVKAHIAEERVKAEVSQIVSDLRTRAEIRVLEAFED
jgi:hypothetical protein